MPTVVLKLFAGQGTKRMDDRTDKAAATICSPFVKHKNQKMNMSIIFNFQTVQLQQPAVTRSYQCNIRKLQSFPTHCTNFENGSPR